MRVGRFTIQDPFRRGSVKYRYKPEKTEDGKEQEYYLKGICDLTANDRNRFSGTANAYYGGHGYGIDKIQSWLRIGGSLS